MNKNSKQKNEFNFLKQFFKNSKIQLKNLKKCKKKIVSNFLMIISDIE